jgi:hypothetical protein
LRKPRADPRSLNSYPLRFLIAYPDDAPLGDSFRCSASPVTSTRNSASGTANSALPQFKQTNTSGKTQTVGLLTFFRSGKWMTISPVNFFCLSDPHDLHISCTPKTPVESKFTGGRSGRITSVLEAQRKSTIAAPQNRRNCFLKYGRRTLSAKYGVKIERLKRRRFCTPKSTCTAGARAGFGISHIHRNWCLIRNTQNRR